MNDAPSRTQVHDASNRRLDPPADLPPGYESHGILGRGGMGVVYRATQTDLGRDVAVKMVLAGGHASTDELARFELEARTVGGVEHRNVVRVFHAGRHGGRPFLALELLAEGSLADRLRDGPLRPVVAARIVAAIARGVAACHAAGVLHRDLKPANVLFEGTGDTAIPKVADFGLAKRLKGESELTATGAVLGTPSYMAPEQARGEDVGVTTDVYGLGAILYATLVGKPPFQSPSVSETLRRVIADDPISVRQLQPDTPRDLETICTKCLAKNPARRYATSSALADDLQRWLDGKPIQARPTGPLERSWKLVRRNPTVTAVILALSVGFGTAVWQAVVAVRARIVAVRAREATAEEARNVELNLQFFRDVLSQSSGSAQASARRKIDPNLSVKKALDYTSQTLGERFLGQPLREAVLRVSVGQIYYELGQYPDAAFQYEQALAIRRKHLPPLDPLVLGTINDLGETYRHMGDKVTEAKSLLVEALAGRRLTLGDHPDTFQTINNLGLVCQLEKDWDSAEWHFREAVAGRRRLLGPGHVATVRSVNNLGLLLLRRQRYSDAEPLLVEALAGRRDAMTGEHPEVIEGIFNLAVCYRRLDPPSRMGQAETLYREGVGLLQQSAPSEWRTGEYFISFADLLRERLNYGEAEKYLHDGYGLLTTAPGLTEKQRQTRLTNAAAIGVKLYRDWNEPEKAAAWKAKTESSK